jgi:DNA-binding protein H-NS
VSYATYVDPDNPSNTYVRGVLPGWMKDQMKATGFDPKNKEDRETFKQKHLKVAS